MAKLSDLIWKNAELLRGALKENEYRKVILPFTILRRLDCVLAPIRCRVLFWSFCSVLLMAWSVQEVRAEPWTTPDAAGDKDASQMFPRVTSRSDTLIAELDRTGNPRLTSASEAQSGAAPGNSQDTSHDSVFTSANKDLTALGHAAATPDFWRAALQIAGISLISAIADKPLDKLAVNHGNNWIMSRVEAVGNNLPFVAIGYSAMTFLTSDEDSRLARASYSSLAAGGVGAFSALGLKYMVGRARPTAGQGSISFTPVSAGNGNTSWPSMHSTVMWAVITPYAKAYDASWLYGVAAVTNVARVGARHHWFSDTVAGSLLGYAFGDFMWEQHRYNKHGVEWAVSPNGVTATWKLE